MTENLKFSESISAYLEAPQKKTVEILAKGLDVNYSLPEGERAAVNR